MKLEYKKLNNKENRLKVNQKNIKIITLKVWINMKTTMI